MTKSQTYFLRNWYWVEQYLDGSYFSLSNSQENQWSEMLLLLLNEAGSGLKRFSDSTRLLFQISKHPLVFQNFWIAFTKILLKRFKLDWFKCKPFLQGINFHEMANSHLLQNCYTIFYVKCLLRNVVWVNLGLLEITAVVIPILKTLLSII